MAAPAPYFRAASETLRIQFQGITTGPPPSRKLPGDSAFQYLPQISNLLAEGKQKEAEDPVRKHNHGAQDPDEKELTTLKQAWIRQMVPTRAATNSPR